MRIVIFFGLMIGSMFACSGDCMSCHPALKKNILTDERHKPMLTCIACHENEEAGISECGKDCFSCHDVDKIDMETIVEHKVITQCRNCHMNIPKTLGSQIQDSSKDTTIEELLQSSGGLSF